MCLLTAKMVLHHHLRQVAQQPPQVEVRQTLALAVAHLAHTLVAVLAEVALEQVLVGQVERLVTLVAVVMPLAHQMPALDRAVVAAVAVLVIVLDSRVAA